MKYRILATSDRRLTKDLRDDILQLSTLAFANIRAEEVVKRFESYDRIGLAFSRDNTLLGFTFISEHWIDTDCYLGFRLSAVHPEWQGQGVLTRLGLRIYWHRIAVFYRSKLFQGRRSARLYMFSRVCSPKAYKAIHIGPRVFPDLIREGGRIPSAMQVHFKRLQDALQLSNFDPATGVIRSGAENAGIHPPRHDISKHENWHMPWSSHVPEGSELLAVVPLSPGAILGSVPQLARIGVRRRTLPA